MTKSVIGPYAAQIGTEYELVRIYVDMVSCRYIAGHGYA